MGCDQNMVSWKLIKKRGRIRVFRYDVMYEDGDYSTHDLNDEFQSFLDTPSAVYEPGDIEELRRYFEESFSIVKELRKSRISIKHKSWRNYVGSPKNRDRSKSSASDDVQTHAKGYRQCRQRTAGIGSNTDHVEKNPNVGSEHHGHRMNWEAEREVQDNNGVQGIAQDPPHRPSEESLTRSQVSFKLVSSTLYKVEQETVSKKEPECIVAKSGTETESDLPPRKRRCVRRIE